MAPKPISFAEAIKKTNGKARALLLGNGFSIKYSNYKTLIEKAPLEATDPLRAVFRQLKTVDFEAVVRALDDAALVELGYGEAKRAAALSQDAMRLRKALVEAVRATHPKSHQEIEEVSRHCLEFLRHFSQIFTVNYDLLLNWVVAGSAEFGDGFGLAKEIAGFRRPFTDDRRCNVYNLHGGLHLFNGENGKVEKRVGAGFRILDAIEQTVTSTGRFPLYVAEGTSAQKQHKIDFDHYLKHCYGRLQQITGTFFVFGHSASESDAHLYSAIFNASIEHLYFCVYLPSNDLAEIDARLSSYQKKIESDVQYTFVDSETVSVWRAASD